LAAQEDPVLPQAARRAVGAEGLGHAIALGIDARSSSRGRAM
jgi:hypothetical protein